MTDADGFFGGRGGRLPQLMVEDPTQDPDKLAPDSSISPDEEAEEILRREALQQTAHGLGGQSSRRVAVDDEVMIGAENRAVIEVVGLEPSPPYTFADYVGHREQLQQQEIIQQHQNMVVHNPLLTVAGGPAFVQATSSSPPLALPAAQGPLPQHVAIQMPQAGPPQSMSDASHGQDNDSTPMLCDCVDASEGRHERRCRRKRRRNRRRRPSIRREAYSDSDSDYDSDMERPSRRARRRKSRAIKKRTCLLFVCLVGVSFLLLHIYRTFAFGGRREWPWPWPHHDGPIENSFECRRAPYAYQGETNFEFPLFPSQDENATTTASPLKSFYLKQRPMNENYPWQESPGYHFGGKVSIVGYDLTPGQEPAIKVDFNIHTSKAEMKDMIRLIKGEDGEGVVLYTDYSDRQLIKPLGCATIQATIAIPKGKGAAGLATIPTILSNLDIAVETLCISMDSASLELTVSDKTSLKTLCGGITYSNASIPIDRPFMPGGPGAFGAAPSALPAPSEPFVDTFRLAKSGFSSRLFHAKTQTGAIMAVPLVIFDEVDVETTTGNIRLEYDAASEPNASALAPANINVRSVSGNVYLESPPPSADITSIRRTATTVITTSGKVSGSILLPPSSELTIGSFSGDISPLEVLVLPASSTHFNTDTKTGLTNIRLLETGGDLIEPIEQSGVVIVKGRHNSFSGEIEVSYPQRWQGSILARTLDGRITMRGEGVSIVSENGGAEKSAEVFRRELLEKRPTEEEVKEAESQNGGDIAEEEDDDIATPFSVPPISSGLWKTVRGHKAPTPTSPTPPSSDVRVVSVSGNIEFLVGLRRKSWVEKGRERVERLKSWLSLAAEKSGCSRFRDALIRGDGPFGGPRKPSMPPGPPIMPPGGHERQHSSSR